MHLHSYRLRNFRRLKDTYIELAKDISIFVGANNSGKTSATQAVHAFVTGAKDRFSLYDFNSACWDTFDKLGDIDLTANQSQDPLFPSIDLDLWFEVAASDLYLVIPLLPSIAWQGTKVGIRVSLTAKNPKELVRNYQDLKKKGLEETAESSQGTDYKPWPRSIQEYLQRELGREYELRYFVLDYTKFDGSFRELGEYIPSEISGEPSGGAILKSLIQIDSLGAQRHLADPNPETGGRSEDLSKRLSRFYKRNLNQRQDDHAILKALYESEKALNVHLEEVFKPTLDRLAQLGYPGISNPRLKILSALNPTHIMSQDTRVHYHIGDEEGSATLPDSYNGLGFKNLIYMVVEILDAQARWGTMENRPPLHLIFVEEPEAHLHTQLQQVFIRNVLGLLGRGDEEGEIFGSQMIITTHSPHILYERGFKPIRYFRRKNTGQEQLTEVLNLSEFYETAEADRDFLERYLKITHCDLFFSDAAILVEGNVERLLLPIMIDKVAESLRSVSLCILEVGGAFGHRFKSLIEFLGLTILVITDLDSVDGNGNGKVCLPHAPGAQTSNQTLISWLPKKKTIEELFNASRDDRTLVHGDSARVHVVYQTKRSVEWKGDIEELCGRTLEEDFGLENPEWSQSRDRRLLGLIVKGDPSTPYALAECLHTKVSRKNFNKTTFALAILAEREEDWRVPPYIREGLEWLENEVTRTHE